MQREQFIERLKIALDRIGEHARSKVAERCGVSAQSVSMWLSTGKVSQHRLLTIAQMAHVSVAWLAFGVGDMIAGEVGCPTRAIEGFDEQGDLSPDSHAHIPALTMEVGAGGRINYEVQPDGVGDAYRLDWLASKGLDPEKLFKTQVFGDSMEPMMYAGDWIMVDRSQRYIIDGKQYVIRFGDEMRVKTLFKRPDGGMVISSENKRHPDVVVSNGDDEHVDIIGRVIRLERDI